MQYQSGQSGNPGGKPKEKPFRDALRLAIKRAVADAGDDRVQLNAVAEALVAKAMAGDVPAIKEVADRLDGKVPQQQILNGDEDGGPVAFRNLPIAFVDPPAESVPASIQTE